MLPPSCSSPARITASAASSPASPQPRALAASAASRPSSAAFSAARAVPEPPFSPPGPGGASPPASPGTAGRAWQIASFTSVTRPARSRNRSYSATSRRALLQLRPRLQVHRPRPPVRLPRQVPLRPVSGMTRRGARAVRLAALAAHLVQRPPAEVPDLPQLPRKAPARRRSSSASSSGPSGTPPPQSESINYSQIRPAASHNPRTPTNLTHTRQAPMGSALSVPPRTVLPWPSSR